MNIIPKVINSLLSPKSPTKPLRPESPLRPTKSKSPEKPLKSKSPKSPEKPTKPLKTKSPKNTKNSFIFFGCWNHIDCKKTYTDRDIVGFLLKKLYSNNKIILAGDNWYNQKINKQLKYYPLYVLYTGYKLLFDITQNVDIILGNHDINKDKTRKISVINNFCNNLGCMLYVQNNVIKQILEQTPGIDLNIKIKDVYHYKDNISLYSCKPHLVQKPNNIYFLYINTNVFDESIDIITSYKKLIEIELSKVETINLLFIVGHHPFAGLKEKNNNYSIKTLSELYFKDDKSKDIIIYSFLDLFAKYKSIYLCADIHNFQLSKLHNNICMVIVGTGGAELDIIKEETFNNLPFPINTEYVITELYAHDSYGFSKISYNETNFNVTIDYYYIVSYDKIITYNIYSYLLTYVNNSWNIAIKTVKLLKKIKIDEPIKHDCTLFTTKKTTKEEILKDLRNRNIIAPNCGIKND